VDMFYYYYLETCKIIYPCILISVNFSFSQIVQEFILGEYDPEATAAFNQNLSDISTLKDPRSKDASQRYLIDVCF